MENNIDIKEKIYLFFDNLIYYIFGKRIEFDVVEHKTINNGFVILLPPKGEVINHIIGRQGRTINALNILVSSWAFQNKIILYVKQKREKNNEESNQ